MLGTAAPSSTLPSGPPEESGDLHGGVVGPRIDVLERIFAPEVAVAVWRRGPDPELAAQLARELPGRELAITERLRAGPSTPEAALERAFGGFGTARAALAAHVAALVDLHATLTDAEHVGLRLAVTRGRPCPRFHVDRVGLRLIATLRGPGTEWLEHAAVDRRRLGLAAGAQREEDSGPLRVGAVIHRLEPFDVGVFKGESWPGNAGRGAVHRSPPPDGDWRVMLSLDAL